MIKFFSLKQNQWSQYTSLISSINQLEKELESLSPESLRKKSQSLQTLSLQADEGLKNKVLIESFALIREASRRQLGLRHYDTQLLGGLVLNENKIAEMQTGEGKTLVATAPAFANALKGKGVHLVTVNEYLAQRDAEWMGEVYRYLGLSVGLVQAKMQSLERRKNYNQDITYLTNNEVGFDFLRDNLVTSVKELVQRPFHYCIIDEADSVLIDEARTPLIISGKVRMDLKKVIKANEVAQVLFEAKDYEVDQKSKSIYLTNKGIKKTQKLLNEPTLFNSSAPWIHYLLNALKAKNLYLKDIHYIVKNQEIILVDEFTGRILDGRQWAEGLQSAIEAKERIYTMQGSQTIACVTYQNFFRFYPKMAGMTGTAKTEELEFESIYNLSVSKLPTFKPVKRVDLPDAVYIDETTKWKAIALECKKMYALQRPLLVGTTTIQNSVFLSLLLKEYKIPHKLLNAKPENIQNESQIISDAGCLASVTIATNMAGRGTDILLGGNPEYKVANEIEFIFRRILHKKHIPSLPEAKALIENLKKNRYHLLRLQKNFKHVLNVVNRPNKSLTAFDRIVLNLYKVLLKNYQKECTKERKKVLKLGGLYVIGTERHESRRIDNQLRGRAGRQGDPGTSRFFLSLSDPLIQTFGGESVKNLMSIFDLGDEALESKFLSDTLDSAQQKVESLYYDQRKNLSKYDSVLDRQRFIVYEFRKNILVSPNLRDLVLEFGELILNEVFSRIQTNQGGWKKIKRIHSLIYALNLSLEKPKASKTENLEILKDFAYEDFWVQHFILELVSIPVNESMQKTWTGKNQKSLFTKDSKLQKRAPDQRVFWRYEKLVILKYIDLYWSKHLENLNFLKDTVSWTAYAQKDPFFQYEEQAYVSFKTLLKQCRDTIIYHLIVAKPF